MLDENNIVPKKSSKVFRGSQPYINPGWQLFFYYSDQASVYTENNTSILTLMTFCRIFNRIAGTDYTLENPQDVIFICL